MLLTKMQQPPHANMIFLAFSLLYCDIFALVAALQNQSTPAAATATAAAATCTAATSSATSQQQRIAGEKCARDKFMLATSNRRKLRDAWLPGCQLTRRRFGC